MSLEKKFDNTINISVSDINITENLEIPTYTTTQMNALTNNVIGDIIYNSTADKIYFYNGTTWKYCSTDDGSGKVSKSGDVMTGGLAIKTTTAFGTDNLIFNSNNNNNYFMVSADVNPNVTNRFFVTAGPNSAEVGCYSGADGLWKNLLLNTGGGYVGINNGSPAASLDVIGSFKLNGAAYASNGYYVDSLGNQNFGMRTNSGNLEVLANNGNLILKTSTAGDIICKPIYTNSFKVSTNNGGFDAFSVYSNGSDTVLGNTVGYAGVMKPLSSGRFILPYFSSDPSSAATAEIYYNTSTNKINVYNGSSFDAISQSVTSSTNHIVSTGTYTITVSGGGTVVNYSLSKSNNLIYGVNTWAGEIALDLAYTTKPTNIYSWHINICNSDSDTTILQAKFTGTGPFSATTNKLKVFSGSGVALSSLSDGTYNIAVTIYGSN